MGTSCLLIAVESMARDLLELFKRLWTFCRRTDHSRQPLWCSGRRAARFVLISAGTGLPGTVLAWGQAFC